MSRDAVRAALDAVADMAPEDPLRPIAFQEVLRASLAGRSSDNSKQAGRSSSQEDVDGPRSPVHAGETEDAPVGRLTQRLGLDRDVVAQVFDFDGEQPTLIVPSSRLPAAKATATQHIAVLICAAMQGGLGQSETSADLIRRTCEDFGRYDESNFAATLRQISQLLIPSGTPRTRTYRLSRPGYDRARSLVEGIVSAHSR